VHTPESKARWSHVHDGAHAFGVRSEHTMGKRSPDESGSVLFFNV